MKNNIIIRANSRGYADHGWLKSYHTFSFANYKNEDRVHFGVLRVLNDDLVAPGMGFGTHPHDNMEIISIPLSGELSHKDSIGNGTIIKTGEIQIMSAGTGINHSEFNPNDDVPSQFLQIWLFPNKLNVKPRYDQITLNPENRLNKWDQILSPNPDDNGVWIHQDAWFSLADLDKDKQLEYTKKEKNNGLYLFVLEGSIFIENTSLGRRDAIGIIEKDEITLSATENAKILLMDIPMELPDYLK
ncbi:pirin family protein [Myroides pelagicus]|uniref:Pirin family protein n=1 Tax=Myroides pelagicus TaxID=270914 RepID=A0A7K1GHW6_9FLAO|nr:pirin family protein [Myroides pelagicus]MEC4112529.1 pirin family protein [Myroides pelagicus]MTH28552.1 pirin family protein [Myroides pelagicus]